jgi:hypothetical protein
MSVHARRAALLAIVAALLLANPLYVGAVVDEPPSRSPTGYTATAVDPTNASDQRRLIRAVGGDDVVSVAELADANEYQPHGDAYRAPGRAATLLRTAAADGAAHTDDADAGFTLHRVGASYRYVAVDGTNGTRYYRVGVGTTGGGTTVTATAVDRATVARGVLYADARLYASLPAYQRETVDAVIAADESGYRPYNDEFVDLTDDVLVKDDAYYVFSAGVHVDDFGPSRQWIVEALLTLLGLVSLVAAAVLTAVSFRREGPDP